MGRLIDADKVIEDMQYYHDDCAKTSEYTRLGFETAIEVVNDAPTVEAIPKAEYEARLKVDMVARLTDIRNAISKQYNVAYGIGNYEYARGLKWVNMDVIQQKINSLKEDKE